MNFEFPTVKSKSISRRTEKYFKLFFTVPKIIEIEHDKAFLESSEKIFVPYKEIEVSAFAWGEGPIVLLVHGWRLAGISLRHFVKPLVDAGYRIICFDAPGYGRTDGKYPNLFEFAGAVQAIAKHQGPLYAVVAHSLGAASVTYSLKKELTINRMVFLSPLCWLYNSVTQFFNVMKVDQKIQEEFVDIFEEKFGQDVWEVTSCDKILKTFDIPLLVFHDPDDSEVSYEHGVAIAKAGLNTELLQIRDVGHQGILNDDHVVVETVRFICS